MTKRKKFFKTKKEATAYRKTFQPRTVFDPKPEEMKVFPYGKKFFLGTGVEFDCVRFS